MPSVIRQMFLYIFSFLLSVMPTTQYTEGVVGQPRSFLPGKAITATDKTISRLTFRGLFKYDIYGSLVPDLADSWEIDSEGLVYTIKLKDNQYWSDGTKITADDLIYTAFQVEDLQGVGTDRVDELTVRYILPNRFSPFLSMLTIGIMPNGSDTMNPLVPLTSGPFHILRIEKSGPAIQRVILYNTNETPKLRKLIFRYYADEKELVLGAQLGEVDGFVATKNYQLENYNSYRYPLQGVYYALFFNQTLEELQDVEFRKKLREVLPVEQLTSHLGITVEGPLSRSIFTDKSLTFDYYNKNHVPEAYNQSLVITVPDIKKHTDLAKQIEDMWEDQLGLDVHVREVAPESFNEVIEGRNYEVLLYGQEVGRDPDRYINWHSTQKAYPGLNLSGFEQVRADRALEEGRNELDYLKRQVHYSEFQKSVLNDAPAVFLYHPFITYYVSNRVDGIGEKYTFTVGDRFLDFDNWSKLKTN